MIHHKSIQHQLYPYLKKELHPDEHRMVEDHLASCDACMKELQEIRSVLDAFPEPHQSPSGSRTEEFWNAFAFNVEQRIRGGEIPHNPPRPSFPEFIDLLLVHRWRIVAATVALGVILGSLVFVRFPNVPEEVHQQVAVSEPAGEAEMVTDRANQYFQKSKLLLVGITNLKTTEGQPVDVTTERRVSRELVHEARYLKQQPLDERSTKLINNLDRILIELANMEQETDLPNVEMIRSGIRQENLLFKIRMAQPMYDSTQFIRTRYSY